MFGHIDALRGGGELNTKRLEALCAQRGIEVQRAVPYHHSDLGPIERSWRTIADLERSMRQWAGVPKYFWTYSWKHAVDITNRMPRKGNPGARSPYEAIIDQDLPLLEDVLKLPIWGCLAYVHIPVEKQKSKLDPRAQTGIFLGTARHRKGYKIFIHATRKIVVSRDVTFSDQPGWTTELFKKAEVVPDLVESDSESEHDNAEERDDTPAEDDMPDLHSSSDEDDDWDADSDDYYGPTHASHVKESDSSDIPDTAGVEPSVPLSPEDCTKQGEHITPDTDATARPAPEAVHSKRAATGASKTRGATKKKGSPPPPPGHDPHAVEVSAQNILPEPKAKGAQGPRRSARLRGHARINYDEGEELRTAGILELLAQPSATDDPQAYTQLYEHLDESFLTFGQVMNMPDRHLWRAAIVKELRELRALNTWEFAPLPLGRRAIRHKWVFRRKLKADGSVERYKARLVARGFTEQPGVDYFETFAAVVRPESVRLLISISKLRNLKLFQVDIGNAFLNATLEEEIYLNLPQGLDLDSESGVRDAVPGSVLHLLRGLPGLKQSCRNWYKRIREWLVEHGFEPSANDPCIFCHKTTNLVIGVYVDDFLIAAESEGVYNELVKELSKDFRVSAMGPLKWFLGVEIESLPSGGFSLSQELYIKRICADHNITLIGREFTPMMHDFISSSAAGEGPAVDPTDYRSRIGSLLHLVKWTRPDIAFAVGFLARFSSDPKQGALQGVNKVFRYVLFTAHLKLVLDPQIRDGPLRLDAFSDSDFAFNPMDRKSITGWIVLFFGAPINWSSKRQEIVATSTLEAEFIALFTVSQECLFLQRHLGEFVRNRFQLAVPLTLCDNNGALALSNDPCAHKRSKHIDIKYRAIQDRVAQSLLVTKYVPTDDNIADLLTKPVSRVRLDQLRSRLLGVWGVSEGECWKLALTAIQLHTTNPDSSTSADKDAPLDVVAPAELTPSQSDLELVSYSPDNHVVSNTSSTPVDNSLSTTSAVATLTSAG